MILDLSSPQSDKSKITTVAAAAGGAGWLTTVAAAAGGAGWLTTVAAGRRAVGGAGWPRESAAERGRGLRVTVGQECRAPGGLVCLVDRRGGKAKRMQGAQKAAIGLV